VYPYDSGPLSPDREFNIGRKFAPNKYKNSLWDEIFLLEFDSYKSHDYFILSLLYRTSYFPAARPMPIACNKLIINYTSHSAEVTNLFFFFKCLSLLIFSQYLLHFFVARLHFLVRFVAYLLPKYVAYVSGQQVSEMMAHTA
jgi:hypothetical protein